MVKNTKAITLGQFAKDELGILHGKFSGLGIGSTSIISEDVQSVEGKIYAKLIADPFGAAYEVGAAFPREKDGMQYYSVVLDSPIFEAPLNALLFPDKEGPNTFTLVWYRPEQKPSVEATPQTRHQGRRFVGARINATPS